MSLSQEYAQHLSMLTGNAFQDEVCIRLGTVILSFQPVPPKPQGDAGLDGISHQVASAATAATARSTTGRKERRSASRRSSTIQERFAEAFRIEADGKKLVQSDNKEIETIPAEGTMIKHICLIVNWLAAVSDTRLAAS